MSENKNNLEEMINSAVKQIQDGFKDVCGKVDVERKKLDIKSQIGHHERAIRQAYSKLGEAYYDYAENNSSMEGSKDTIAIIKANLKVIDLLNQQLNILNQK